MFKQYFNRFRYWLEGLAFAGIPAQILTFTLIIFFISVFFGLAIFIGTSEFQGFDGMLEAIWWAFLRLSDPGYLGDDHGFIKRIISTLLTVLGYVFFLGSFIALMTQYMFRALREMENGTTPLFLQDHILILGLNSRSQILVEGILKSHVHRKDFSLRTDVHHLKIVILCEKLDAQIFYRFKQSMGDLWGPDIHLRGGSALKLEDLRRVNFLKASSIIMPAVEGISVDSDARHIKTLLTIISSVPNEDQDEAIPPIVIEMISRKKASIAKSLYSKNVEIVATDVLLSRIIAQNVRHTGLAQVYSELLRRHFGNCIFVQPYPELQNHPYSHVKLSFPHAIVMGVLKKIGHRQVPLLNPPSDTVIDENDQIVLIAKNSEALVCRIPDADTCNLPFLNIGPVELPKIKRRVLILGWNQQTASVIHTFSSYKNETFEVINISRAPISERQKKLMKIDYDPEKIQIQLIEGDHNNPKKLKAIKPETFTDIIMFSTENPNSEHESDARIIVGHLVLDDHLRTQSHRPDILVELADHQNERLFINNSDEILVVPLILSHMLSQVALKPEINEVYEDLLDTTDHEISITSAKNFELSKQPFSILVIEEKVSRSGLTFLGYIKISKNGKTKRQYFINPPKNEIVTLLDEDEIIFLT